MTDSSGGGLFSKLLNPNTAKPLEPKVQKETKQLPASDSPTPKQITTVPIKKQDDELKKPEFMKTRKPETFSPTNHVIEKPEKYSTLLKKSLVKKIKNYATEMDISDYEVLDLALTEYFEKYK